MPSFLQGLSEDVSSPGFFSGALCAVSPFYGIFLPFCGTVRQHACRQRLYDKPCHNLFRFRHITAPWNLRPRPAHRMFRRLHSGFDRLGDLRLYFLCRDMILFCYLFPKILHHKASFCQTCRSRCGTRCPSISDRSIIADSGVSFCRNRGAVFPFSAPFVPEFRTFSDMCTSCANVK